MQTALIIQDVLASKLKGMVDLLLEQDTNLVPNGNYLVEADTMRFVPDKWPQEVIMVTHMPFIGELAYELGLQTNPFFSNCETVVFEEQVKVNDFSKTREDIKDRQLVFLWRKAPDEFMD